MLGRVQSVPGVVEMLWQRMVNGGDLAIIMERLKGPDLFDYINELKSAMSEGEARKLFKQVLQIAIGCHNCGVVHRDIKDENIMFDAEGKVKLIDFGCATFINVNDDHGRLRKFAGTRALAPPEWLTLHEYHAEPITVWQLGSLLFNMLCGNIPFQTDSQIISGSIIWSRGVSDACRSLVGECLKKAPAERPSLMQIAEHAWVRQTVLSNAQNN